MTTQKRDTSRLFTPQEYLHQKTAPTHAARVFRALANILSLPHPMASIYTHTHIQRESSSQRPQAPFILRSPTLPPRATSTVKDKFSAHALRTHIQVGSANSVSPMGARAHRAKFARRVLFCPRDLQHLHIAACSTAADTLRHGSALLARAGLTRR